MIAKRTIKVALLLLLIFVAGGFCGWWIGSSSSDEKVPAPPAGPRSPAAQRQRLINELIVELKLSPEQRASIEKVLDGWQQEAKRNNQEHMRNRHALFEKVSPMIRTNLTAEQQKTYDRMTQQAERKWRRILQEQ
jgi:uncharacterized membrane protein